MNELLPISVFYELYMLCYRLGAMLRTVFINLHHREEDLRPAI
jgi:hypothetical protein